MDVQVVERGAFSWVQVHLDPADKFISEAGAMFRASTNIDPAASAGALRELWV